MTGSRPRTRLARALMWAGVLLLLAEAGCAQRGWPGLQSTNPVQRSQTIVSIARARDYSAVPALVDRLEDSDRAVRMYAIVALRELVGEDFGYRFYGPEAERAGAVAAWREALRQGRVKAVPPKDRSGSAPAGGRPRPHAEESAALDAIQGRAEVPAEGAQR
jgi:hypothetical protein